MPSHIPHSPELYGDWSILDCVSASETVLGARGVLWAIWINTRLSTRHWPIPCGKRDAMASPVSTSQSLLSQFSLDFQVVSQKEKGEIGELKKYSPAGKYWF